MADYLSGVYSVTIPSQTVAIHSDQHSENLINFLMLTSKYGAVISEKKER